MRRQFVMGKWAGSKVRYSLKGLPNKTVTDEGDVKIEGLAYEARHSTKKALGHEGWIGIEEAARIVKLPLALVRQLAEAGEIGHDVEIRQVYMPSLRLCIERAMEGDK